MSAVCVGSCRFLEARVCEDFVLFGKVSGERRGWGNERVRARRGGGSIRSRDLAS